MGKQENEEMGLSEKILTQEFEDNDIDESEKNKEVILSAMDKYLEESQNDYKDKYLRLYADFDNYKKRNSKQKTHLESQIKFDVSKNLIDIMDDIDLSKEKFDEDSLIEWSDGAIIIFDNLKSKLSDMGIEKIDCEVGDKFDPNKHEAISVVDVDDQDTGKLVHISSSGYSINDTIVRYPKVVVSK
jgi:molecular chaperone GrpE